VNERVLTERRDHVLVITINRPEAKNAFDLATARAMHRAMDLLDAEDELFIGVITGAGKTFSAGADLKAVARNERASTERGGFGMFRRPSRKPPWRQRRIYTEKPDLRSRRTRPYSGANLL
jgi:enoyl-CoA hydratase